MAAVVGVWVAVIGYGIAYSGIVKLAGGSCSLMDAFKGRCSWTSKGAGPSFPFPLPALPAIPPGSAPFISTPAGSAQATQQYLASQQAAGALA